MRPKLANPDLLIAQIAGRQHGVITLLQLIWAGLSREQVKRRARAGRLHRIHRGVYAVGHPKLTIKGTWFAAVAALGPRAALSHDSAASLWGQSPFPTSAVAVAHVTVPTGGARAKRDGIVVHRSGTLTPRDTTRRENIPVTTPERTRKDLGFGPEPTKSELERIFLRLCARHRIPKPQVNRWIGPHRVDCLWPEARLVCELDSWRFHSSRASFGSDRARDRYLALRGYTVIRFTYWEVVREAEGVAGTVRRLLAA